MHVIALFGPTGVGKTAVAIALAERLRACGEDPLALSADALQVYRGLELLTGAASAAERARLEHRLLSFVAPEDSFSAGEFAALAHQEIDGALSAGRRPIVVGGTGLYLQAALTELELRPPPEPELRARIEADLAARGPEALHAELARRSPATAAGVDPRDRTRVIRALELLEMGAEPAPPGENSRLWTARLRHPTLLCGLTMERPALYERIDARVEAIVAAGAADEVTRADAAGASRTARAALGFEELLRGDVEAMRRRTRNYAKRQLTWMRRLPDVHEIDLTERTADQAAGDITRILAARQGGPAPRGEVPVRRLLVSAALVAASFVLVPAAYGVPDYASTARNIIPSSQYGSVPPPPGADVQARMYDDLTPLFGNVRTSHLSRYFKSEALGIGGDGPVRRERIPREGVRLLRDRFNVPHIWGRTDDDVTFAAGWVTAEDRELLLEQARYNARVDAVEVPGLDGLRLVVGLQSFRPSRQTEREIAKQIGILRESGRRGRRLLHDMDVYVRGINAYYRANDRDYAPWTRLDVIALNAIKSQVFGEGGGDEARNSMFLDALQSDLGARRGVSVWNDLRQVDDPESPVSVKRRFPYITPPSARPGSRVIDNGSFQPVPIGGAPAASLAMRAPEASNVLMVAGRRSASGHPLFVGGPQVRYFYPGLTLEMDLHGPGWSARGASAVPFPGYILIGRREDFVWTLTSAGADIIDTYVETLCDGSDLKYRYKGRCRSMERFQAGTLGGEPVEFHRTIHGSVVGYAATVDGRRVAISRKRSSYLREATDQLLFQRLTRGRVRSAREFFRAASISPQTFNTFYADDDEAAMITTGRLPVRPKGVDPGLPTDGRGRYEWRGFVGFDGHPRGIVRRGVLNNWNNQPARDFGPADNQRNYGSIHRVDLLNRNVAQHRRHTLATLTGAMNKAARLRTT